jgi:hypothetical protein
MNLLLEMDLCSQDELFQIGKLQQDTVADAVLKTQIIESVKSAEEFQCISRKVLLKSPPVDVVGVQLTVAPLYPTAFVAAGVRSHEGVIVGVDLDDNVRFAGCVALGWAFDFDALMDSGIVHGARNRGSHSCTRA